CRRSVDFSDPAHECPARRHILLDAIVVVRKHPAVAIDHQGRDALNSSVSFRAGVGRAAGAPARRVRAHSRAITTQVTAGGRSQNLTDPTLKGPCRSIVPIDLPAGLAANVEVTSAESDRARVDDGLVIEGAASGSALTPPRCENARARSVATGVAA